MLQSSSDKLTLLLAIGFFLYTQTVEVVELELLELAVELVVQAVEVVLLDEVVVELNVIANHGDAAWLMLSAKPSQVNAMAFQSSLIRLRAPLGFTVTL